MSVFGSFLELEYCSASCEDDDGFLKKKKQNAAGVVRCLSIICSFHSSVQGAERHPRVARRPSARVIRSIMLSGGEGRMAGARWEIGQGWLRGQGSGGGGCCWRGGGRLDPGAGREGGGSGVAPTVLSSSSLVGTNEHLLQELSQLRAQHKTEVEQLHWSYKELKKTLGLFPQGSAGPRRLLGPGACAPTPGLC